MADTETTTVLTAEVVRYDDPVIITERVAVSAFIAGYTDPTRRSYATDLRIFAGWCHDHGINLPSGQGTCIGREICTLSDRQVRRAG